MSTLQSTLGDYEGSDDLGETECPTCHRDDFASRAGMRQHHTVVHGERLGVSTVECTYCGGDVEIEDYRLERVDRPFCPDSTRGCRGKWLSENQRAEDHPNWAGRTDLTCEICGTVFSVPPSEEDRRFCGPPCRYVYMSDLFSGEGGPAYDGGKQEHTCVNCGDTFDAFPSDERRHCGRPCFIEWLKENRSGIDHPNWRGGETLRDTLYECLQPGSWKQIAAAVREKADGECEMCGGSDDGSRLDVHHVIPIMGGGTNGLWNLMALCNTCHGAADNYALRRLGLPVRSLSSLLVEFAAEA